MNIANAWAVLGKDWDAIVRDLQAMPDSASRVQAAEQLLIQARKAAQRLMALHHPDRNPSDPEATKRFQGVGAALAAIESHTQSFKDNYAAMMARADQRRETDGFIILK